MTVLIFILLLSLLVVIHELGHWWAAGRAGVKIHEFGFGYPPRLYKLFRWRGTWFTLNAIPFGGFVRLEGEEFNPAQSETAAPSGAFYTKSALTRLGVIAAGPLANLLFGIMAFSIVFGIVGVPHSLDNRPRVEAVSVGSPAELAGVEPGYEIIGFVLPEFFVATPTIADVVKFAADHRGSSILMTAVGPCEGLRCPSAAAEKTFPILIRSTAETPSGQGSMGIIFADFFLETGPWYVQIPRGIVYGVQQALALGSLIIQAVWGLLTTALRGGGLPADLTGPIGIVDQANRNHLLSAGLVPLLEFAGMLSINLGIMNLLPIPALDGGRLLFIGLEKMIGKHRIQSIEGYAHYGGFILLIGLIVLVSIRDIAALFRT